MSEKDMTLYRDVWVFAEQREGKLMPVVLELLGEGKRLADDFGVQLGAILVGNHTESLVDQLGQYGADVIYVAEDERLTDFNTACYTRVIAEAVQCYKPEIFLIGATYLGRDLAPRLAARLNTGLTADCTKLEKDPEQRRLLQTRPAFGGNLMATIVCPEHRPQMSTVRPGVMGKAIVEKERAGKVIRLSVNLTLEDQAVRLIEVIKSKRELVSLTDAEFIVSGGKGLGKPEGFELLQRLADKLGGVVGSSRAAVDEGWIDHSRQIGQTGTTVKPKIYIACGISGAIQHIAGMQDADVIIAINKNKDAPIFNVADYGIVGDLYEAVPCLIETLEAM